MPKMSADHPWRQKQMTKSRKCPICKIRNCAFGSEKCNECNGRNNEYIGFLHCRSITKMCGMRK